MSPRASLPGADELFRKTAQDDSPPAQNRSTNLQVAKETDRRGPKHEEKVTFYCSAEELTRLERARLTLRADHGLGSDRGRIVRAALQEVLEDFESRGANSALVKRLQ